MSYEAYIGRTIDVSAFQGTRTPGIPLDMVLASETSGGELVTGPLKLAQRVAIMLPTEKGSLPHLPDYGTDFMTQARQGYLRTELDVRAAFAEAVVDIQDQFRETENVDDPDDEKLDTVSLVALDVSLDFISMTVQVLSRAGTARTIILPLHTSL